MQSATPGVGTIYCSGVRVDGRGVETLGNIRFIGQGAYTAGNQGTFITWDHIVDSRPWDDAALWAWAEPVFGAAEDDFLVFRNAEHLVAGRHVLLPCQVE